MAKVPDTVVGVDIGRYSLKSVLLHRRSGGRISVTHYGFHVPREVARDAEALRSQFKVLFRQMGASAKVCSVSVSGADALLRIVEQPETPTEILREVLRINGNTLLNQDVRNYVVDCDPLSSGEPNVYGSSRWKYLVGGLPRAELERINEALT
jgi:Tfp pilus assembly PilM family ATPase